MSFRYLWIGLIIASLTGCSVDRLGGASRYEPEDIGNLSEAAKELVAVAKNGIDPEQFVDYHVHALSTGSSGNGSYLGEPLTGSISGRMLAALYKSGAGIIDEERADQQFVDRLLALRNHSGLGGKTHLLAYDQSYLREGSVNPAATMFYIPNDYVVQLSEDYPDHFVPVISVHPYNPNAIAEIERWGSRGVRWLKWSAPMMEIAPNDVSLEPFYLAMEAHGMTLLSHGGPYSLADEQSQHFGNPLYLKLPLSLGVKVVVAHSASGGECTDIEDRNRLVVPCFNLFVRMLNEPQYRGLLFGDISAMLNSSHLGAPLNYLLAHPELHERLIYGSDYPGPAINVVINTADLVDGGFVSERERELLNEIYDYNPLLFDFVMQRSVRHPVTGQGFSHEIFQRRGEITSR